MMDALEQKSGPFPQSAVPLGRAATPTEVAKLISFLLSDEAGFITGAIYRIDGVGIPVVVLFCKTFANIRLQGRTC